MIKLLRPKLPGVEALRPYLARIDANRWYSNFGPLSKEFEDRFAEMFLPTSMRIRTAANCGLALELAIPSLGLTNGTALLPAVTFPGTGAAALRAGMQVAFADVDAHSWQLTPQMFEHYLESNPIPELVMPVAAFGLGVDSAGWEEIAARYGCQVLVDAAGAVGNQDFSEGIHYAVSFHATKALPMGEGGGFITRDKTAIGRFERLVNFGIDTKVNRGYVDIPGTNAKLSEYHSAIGLASLDVWRKTSADRKAILRQYLELLSDRAPSVRTQQRIEDCICSVFPILLPELVSSDPVAHYLAANNIETRRWYLPPLHEHPLFTSAKRSSSLSNCDTLSKRLIGLPFQCDLGPRELDLVVCTLCDAIASATE
jgi:dTDP-4-amino-4,6-dideoxygalactose transaminase